MKFTYQYRPTRAASIGFWALLCLGALLAAGRWSSVFGNDFVIISAEIHSHISNLTLSLIGYLTIGYCWLLFGVKFRFLVVLGAVLVAGNFACETLMGFLNTTDITDAVYGTIGAAIAFVYLALTKKYGLRPARSDKR